MYAHMLANIMTWSAGACAPGPRADVACARCISSHRLPDGFGTNGVCTEGTQIHTFCNI